MITEKQIVPMLIESFPSFTPDEDNIDLPYVVFGDFARFALDLYRRSDVSQLQEIGKIFEKLHLEGDNYVGEAATIGGLEGIQNVWGNSGVDPDQFMPYLLPESKNGGIR
jgi:hypothetical protein